jgi:hypothetical protein
MVTTASDLDVQATNPVRPGIQSWRACIWISLVLWIASNVLVTAIAKFATWEGNASYVRMADLCRWDCSWYAGVIERGYDRKPFYDTGEADWPFHPLFPATAYPLSRWFGLSPATSMVLAGKIGLWLAIYSFLLLMSEQASTTAARFRAGSLVAFNPYVIYAHAGYAEPLYFALIALAFYFAERRRWIASGAMGGLASATRFVGFLYAVSYAVAWVRELRTRPQWRKPELNQVIGLLLCPLGAALFLLYLHARMGDALVQQHAQVAWHKLPGNPARILWICLTAHRWPRLWGMMVVVALALGGWLIKIHKPELGIFLILAILLPLSATFWCIPRYIWWEPPLLWAIYRILERYPLAWLFYLTFTASFASFMTVEWFSGHTFVM